MGLQVQELQQKGEGQTQEGKVPGQAQEGSCSSAISLSGAWPILFPCLPGWTSPGYYWNCPSQTVERY